MRSTYHRISGSQKRMAILLVALMILLPWSAYSSSELDENIESRPLWKPMHMQPIFKTAKMYGGSVCEELFQKGLCLPSGSNLTKDDLNRVIKVIKDNA